MGKKEAQDLEYMPNGGTKAKLSLAGVTVSETCLLENGTESLVRHSKQCKDTCMKQAGM